jgi:hypothetical protein
MQCTHGILPLFTSSCYCALILKAIAFAVYDMEHRDLVQEMQTDTLSAFVTLVSAFMSPLKNVYIRLDMVVLNSCCLRH